MGTRSTIAIEFADNSVSQIYCHWDGYLDNNGKILAEHYMDPFKVRELIDLGDFSSLRDTVAETKEGAYSQRGEDCQARRYMNAQDYFEECQQEEYDYILRQVDGTPVWFVRCYATMGKCAPDEGNEVWKEPDRWVTLGEAQGLIERMEEEGVY